MSDMTNTPTQGNTVTLPPGVSIGAGRETSQTNNQGQVVQGMVFPITLPDGTQTTVFVPYATLHNPQMVQALFTTRIDALMGIIGS
jgi:hypothetical protein